MKLTLQQQDIYYEQLLNPNKPIYNIGAKISIKGSIDINALKEAYIELINQHDAYRIILTHCNEEVEVDVINPHHTELDCLDLSGNPNPEMAANDFMQIEFLKPFDLHSGKLLHRFLLIKVDDDFHYLFSVYHHIITDGWGTSLMFQRLVSNYNEILEFGKTKSEFPYAYENFVKNDIEYYHSEGYQRDKEYWLDKYNSLPESFLNRIDDTKEISISKREVLIIKRKAYNQLNSLAKENRVSTFHIILAVLFTYFGRNHQIEDMSIGLPVLNRSKAIFKKTVGLFMGVSPLRVQLDFEKSFLDLILLIKKQLRQDYRHQRFPLGKLINELQLFKEKSRLFNITLSYEKQDYSINFSNTETRVIPLSHQSERVALAVYIREFDEAEDVTIDFDYNVNYFQAKDAQKTIRHIEKIIEKILDEPSINLKEIEYLTEQEIQQFNHDFKGEDLIIPKQLTFIDYFLKQVEHNPNKLAVRDRGVSYTYLETEELSNNIAKNIDYLTDGKKTTIGVQLSRRADLIIVLLGILKSGNAYIPLDPSFPKERLNYILTESKADLLIIEDESVEYIGSQTKLVSVEQIFEINLKNDLGFNLPTSSDTAYIIYTSGSTGKPKGVEILHYSLLNFLLSICEKPGINKNDSLYAVTTFSFDISILEFFIPLVSGATLYIAHQETLADPFNAAKDIIKINPTIIQGTPSFYQMLFNAGWVGNNNLKILCGGDLLSEQLAGRLMDNSQEVWNMYGPTETTIWSSTKKIEKAKDASNIGAAIHNTQFFILDKYMKKLPVGVAGNIYIGGDGLAKGYYRNEELTKRKFIDYQNGIGRRDIYETGDIGQWNEEGEIQFLGRNDNQVKIRGYRIELGDVEDSLNQINEISESVVVVKKGHDSSLLVAYVVKKNDIKIKEIKSFLSLKLPQYMVPEIYVFIDSFPLTPNKKINRKLLSKRDINYEENRKQLEFPRTKIENKISDIWKSILNIKEPINIDSSFFALGGHSLNAVKLAGGIYKEFNCNITLRNIFENSSIRELSRCIQNEGDLEKTPIILKAKNKIGYPLTPSQYQIWLASQKENVSKAYNLFAAYEVDGILDVNIIEQSLGIIVRKFETLRTNFVEENGQVFQRINDEIDISISLLNIKTGEIDDFISEWQNQEFNLEKDPLLKIALINEFNLDKNILLFNAHHIIMDGWSLQLFAQEFIEIFNTLTETNEINPEVPEIQFKDYSEWLVPKLNEKELKDFWKSRLSDFNFESLFMAPLSRNENHSKNGEFLMPLNINVSSIREICNENSVTLHSFLTASLNVVIHKIFGINDFCLGTINSGRELPVLQNQLGMFVKTLPLKTRIDETLNLFDFAKNVQEELLLVNAHQNLPLEWIGKQFFEMILIYQNQDQMINIDEELSGYKLRSYPMERKYSKPHLIFNFQEYSNEFKILIEYVPALYEKEAIELIILRLEKLWNTVLENSKGNINSINLDLDFEVKNTLDFDFNF